MKKVVTLAVWSVLLVGSCNKNKKFNKTLDGSWVQISERGSGVSQDEATRLIFFKDGKDYGEVIITEYDKGAAQTSLQGTYKISDKGETLTNDVSGFYPVSELTPAHSVTHKMTGPVLDQGQTRFTYTVCMTGSITYSSSTTPVNEVNVLEFSKQ